MKRYSFLALFVFVLGCSTFHREAVAPRNQWSEKQANQWYEKKPWLVGCNFIPSTAINELEMWQTETWDPKTIDRELGWAQDLGFTSVRVFLHDIPWRAEGPAFLKRIDQFLGIAHKHHIGVMFVLFDSCWDPFPKPGPQRAPRPHVHNSGWVQCPGKEVLMDASRHDELKPYVQEIIGRFRNDSRIDGWDIFNEPDNMNNPAYIASEAKNKPELALILLKKAFAWAREMNPSQPITSAVWLGHWENPAKLSAMEKFQLEESDVITFHNYEPLNGAKQCVESLRRYHRPIICNEYMARPVGSTFDPVLGYFKSQHVGGYNWGFVSGKSQTIYPWDSWKKTYTSEPPLWFHDIFRQDGTAYKPEEVSYIKSLTGKTDRRVERRSHELSLAE